MGGPSGASLNMPSNKKKGRLLYVVIIQLRYICLKQGCVIRGNRIQRVIYRIEQIGPYYAIAILPILGKLSALKRLQRASNDKHKIHWKRIGNTLSNLKANLVHFESISSKVGNPKLLTNSTVLYAYVLYLIVLDFPNDHKTHPWCNTRSFIKESTCAYCIIYALVLDFVENTHQGV